MKQASRSWNIRFDEVVKGFGFIKNEEEACVYKKASGSSVAFLILYVDDILLIVNDISMLESVKTSLKGRPTGLTLAPLLGRRPLLLAAPPARRSPRSLSRI